MCVCVCEWVWMSDCLIRQHAVIGFHWPQSKNTQTCSGHKHTHFAGWTGSIVTHACIRTHIQCTQTLTHWCRAVNRWKVVFSLTERGGPLIGWDIWRAGASEQPEFRLVRTKNYPNKQLHIQEFKLYTKQHIKLIHDKRSLCSQRTDSLCRSMFLFFCFCLFFNHRNLNKFAPDGMQTSFTKTTKQLHDIKRWSLSAAYSSDFFSSSWTSS